MKVRMTFLGGPDAGNVGENTWGTVGTGQMTFELNKPVEIDTEDPKNAPNKRFLDDMVRKARGNRFYRVEDLDGGPALHAGAMWGSGGHEGRIHRPDEALPQAVDARAERASMSEHDRAGEASGMLKGNFTSADPASAGGLGQDGAHTPGMKAPNEDHPSPGSGAGRGVKPHETTQEAATSQAALKPESREPQDQGRGPQSGAPTPNLTQRGPTKR